MVVAHRVGTPTPTAAACSLATLDRLSGGRAAAHVIVGSSDADVARDGDTLGEADRYRRAGEAVRLPPGLVQRRAACGTRPEPAHLAPCHHHQLSAYIARSLAGAYVGSPETVAARIGWLRAAGVSIIQLDMPLETDQDRELRGALVARLRADHSPTPPRHTGAGPPAGGQRDPVEAVHGGGLAVPARGRNGRAEDGRGVRRPRPATLHR